MNALEYILRFPWVEPLGRTLIHFLWQGALIGTAAWVLLRWLRRHSPHPAAPRRGGRADALRRVPGGHFPVAGAALAFRGDREANATDKDWVNTRCPCGTKASRPRLATSRSTSGR